MPIEVITQREKARIEHVDNAFQLALAELQQPPYKQAIMSRLQQRRASNAHNHDKKVAVIGLGPTGLVASIEAYCKGFDVVAIEPRRQYTREQAFRFPINVFEQWLSDYLAIESIEALDASHPFNKILELEVFAKRKTRIDEGVLFGDEDRQEHEHYETATKYLEKLLYTVLDILVKEDPNNFKIVHDYQFEDYADNKKISLKPYQESSSSATEAVVLEEIDYVLGCDGLHSNTRDKAQITVEPVSNKKNYIAAVFYQDTQTSDKPGFVDQFRSIKNDRFLDAQNDRFHHVRKHLLYPQLPSKQTKAFEEGRFHELPAIRAFFTSIGTYIGVELSPQSLSRRRREADSVIIVDQCKALMRVIFEVYDVISHKDDPAVKQSQEHVLRSGQIFEVQLLEATTKFKKLENGSRYIPLGDANANAHFQTGSGALFGIQSAQRVVEHLGTKLEEDTITSILESIALTLRKKASVFLDVSQETNDNVPVPQHSLPELINTSRPLPRQVSETTQRFIAELESLMTHHSQLKHVVENLVKDIKEHQASFDGEIAINPRGAFHQFTQRCQRSIHNAAQHLDGGLSTWFYDMYVFFLNSLKRIGNCFGGSYTYGKFFSTQTSEIGEVLGRFSSSISDDDLTLDPSRDTILGPIALL